jgi:hypothetical protein
MDYPKGRECGESDCTFLAPKRDAPRANRSIADYECIGKEKERADCPRARSARLAKAVAACEKLVAWDRGGGVMDRSLCEACSLARDVVRG